jgi:hypothetical protein
MMRPEIIEGCVQVVDSCLDESDRGEASSVTPPLEALSVLMNGSVTTVQEVADLPRVILVRAIGKMIMWGFFVGYRVGLFMGRAESAGEGIEAPN